MGKVLIEKCLNNVPNKFELSILAMNRAKEIISGSKTDIETTRFTKKSINKSLKEIEEGKLDIPAMEEKIKKNLLINNLFLKESSKYEEDSGNDTTSDTDIANDDISDFDDVEDDLDDDLEDDLEDDFEEEK